MSITSVRNEAPYLIEWLAHHMATGVSDFLVYSNDCDDGTDEMLDRLNKAGVLTHVRHNREGKKSIQWQALKSAWQHPIRKQADWILVSDVDEFLNIRTPCHDLKGLVDALPEGTDGVVMQWRLFGHNGILNIQDMPVTNQFTHAISAQAQYPIAASMFKTLFRAVGPFNMLGVHRPRQKSPDRAGLPKLVNGSGHPLPQSVIAHQQRLSLFGQPAARDLVDINHYSIRSAAAFLLKKARGLPNRASKPVDLSYWVERNFNTVEDTSIAAMRPATEAMQGQLMAIPGISDLHLRAVAAHPARFAEMVRTRDHHQLLTQILTAGSSEVLPPDLPWQLVQWYPLAQTSSTAEPDKTGETGLIIASPCLHSGTPPHTGV